MLKVEGKIFPPQPRTLFIDFRERNVGRDREKKGEKRERTGGRDREGSINVRKKL